VTINSRAIFSLLPLGSQPLPAGTVLTAIDNVSRRPTSGTFATCLTRPGAPIADAGSILAAVVSNPCAVTKQVRAIGCEPGLPRPRPTRRRPADAVSLGDRPWVPAASGQMGNPPYNVCSALPTGPANKAAASVRKFTQSITYR
jgi:hypothetical protein